MLKSKTLPIFSVFFILFSIACSTSDELEISLVKDTAGNELAIANSHENSTPENTLLTVPASEGLLFNDTNPINGELTVTNFTIGDITYEAGTTAYIAEGEFTTYTDGSYKLVPQKNFHGRIPKIKYKVEVTTTDYTVTDSGSLDVVVTPVDDTIFVPTSINELMDSANSGKTALIQSNLDANGLNVALALDITLQFEGGSITNHNNITGNNTKIINENPYQIFDTNGSLNGTFDIVGVNPAWFGTITNNTLLVKANSIAKSIGSAIEISNDYNLTSGFYLNVSMSSKNKSKISGANEFLLIPSDNVTLYNLTLEGARKSGTKYADRIWITGQHIKIENCDIIDSMIAIRNSALEELIDFQIINNNFTADFTNFPHTSAELTQNDIITLRGAKDVYIDNNRFNIINCVRVFKAADNVNNTDGYNITSPFPTENLHITNNTINVTTNSGKQLIDLFNGSRNVFFNDNTIYATGFSVIFQDKTGHEQNYERNHKVYNNTITCDNRVFDEQGNYGALTPNHESGFMNTEFFNNVVTRISGANLSRSTMEVRFMNDVSIHDNIFILDETFNSSKIMTIYSSEVVNIYNNRISNGYINIGEVFTNTKGKTFSAKAKNINIYNNTISDFGLPTSVYIVNVDFPDAIIKIDSNTIKRKLSGGTYSTIYISGATFKEITITNNTSEIPEASKDYVRKSNSTGTVNDFGNSWN